MSAKHVHRQIEALQQQVASLRSAVTSPAQGQGRCSRCSKPYRSRCKSCRSLKGSGTSSMTTSWWSTSKLRRNSATVRHARTPFSTRWTGSSPLTAGHRRVVQPGCRAPLWVYHRRGHWAEHQYAHAFPLPGGARQLHSALSAATSPTLSALGGKSAPDIGMGPRFPLH